MIVLLGLEFEGNSVSRLEETEVNCSYIRPRILMKLGVEVARKRNKTQMYIYTYKNEIPSVCLCVCLSVTTSAPEV